MKSHSRSSTQSITAMSLAAIALAALALTLSACGGDGDDAADAHDHADGDADHSHDDDGAAGDSSSDSSDNSGGDGEEEYSQLTPDAFQQLKDMWALQIEGPKAQANTLRGVEQEHSDQQLKDLVAQIDAKVTEAQRMLDEATVANGSKTLQVDLPRVLGEAGQLVEKAGARMQEVLQAKFGGGEDGGHR